MPETLEPSAEFRAALVARSVAPLQTGGLPPVAADSGSSSAPGPAAALPWARLTPPEVTRWLAVATGFCIPIATSPAEVLTGCFVLSWLVTERPWQRLGGTVPGQEPTGGEPAADVQRQPAPSGWSQIEWARVGTALGWGSGVALALFALLALGVGWSTAGWERSVRCLLKYRELLLLPLFDQVFKESVWRRRGANAFLAGCSVLLAMSCVEWLTQLDFGLERNNLPTNYVVTKDRIIHGLLMSLLTYLSVGAAWQRRDRWSWLLLGLAGCAVWNNVFLVQGRTGFLALGALAVLWLARQAGRRGVWLGCGLVLCGAGVAATLSPIVRARFDQTVGQFRDQFGEQRQRSIDPRLEFYRHTLTLIARHPVVGTGTGSFEPEYRALAQQHGLPSVSEPHNEYLLLTVQLGLAGGLLFGLLLWSQWRQSRQLPDWEASLVQGAVLTLALGSLFNSLILSVTGGLFWSYLTGLGGAARHANAEPKATS